MKLCNSQKKAFLFLTLLTFSEATCGEECMARMPRGKYQGQCIDTSEKRAVRVLEQQQGKITIENFRKDGQFFKAVIPLNKIESLSYILVDLNAKPINFLGMINISHTQLRFKLQENSFVELHPMKGLDSGAPVLREQDLIVSMNYMAPKGVPYEPVKGFNEDLYASAIQIFSTQDEVKRRFEKHFFNMYEIQTELSGPSAGEVLRYALVESHKNQYRAPYDTWANNCTTVLFDLLDGGLKVKGKKPFRFDPLMVQDTGLMPAFKHLAKRGWVDDNQTTVRLMNEDFGYKLFPSKSNPYFTGFIGKSLKAL